MKGTLTIKYQNFCTLKKKTNNFVMRGVHT